MILGVIFSGARIKKTGDNKIDGNTKEKCEKIAGG